MHVSAPPQVFGVAPAADARPLSGLMVEFDEGTVVTLTAAAVAAQVSVRMRLLPWLLGVDGARAWTYQVRNVSDR